MPLEGVEALGVGPACLWTTVGFLPAACSPSAREHRVVRGRVLRAVVLEFQITGLTWCVEVYNF